MGTQPRQMSCLRKRIASGPPGMEGKNKKISPTFNVGLFALRSNRDQILKAFISCPIQSLEHR